MSPSAAKRRDLAGFGLVSHDRLRSFLAAGDNSPGHSCRGHEHPVLMVLSAAGRGVARGQPPIKHKVRPHNTGMNARGYYKSKRRKRRWQFDAGFRRPVILVELRCGDPIRSVLMAYAGCRRTTKTSPAHADLGCRAARTR